MTGTVKTAEVIRDIGDLAVAAVGIVKTGVGIGSIGKMFEVLRAIKELIEDVPGALPELVSLSSSDSAELGAKSYELVVRVINAVKA